MPEKKNKLFPWAERIWQTIAAQKAFVPLQCKLHPATKTAVSSTCFRSKDTCSFVYEAQRQLLGEPTGVFAEGRSFIPLREDGA
jgi:hypothetical protein